MNVHDEIRQLEELIGIANAKRDYNEVHRLHQELVPLRHKAAEPPAGPKEFILPNYDPGQFDRRDPIWRDILRTLRKLENNIQKQLDRHPSDFVYWALGNTGAHTCWELHGRKIRDLPNLDAYESAP